MSALYVSDLINIRNFVGNAVNNFSIPKQQAKELYKMLTVLDKKIVDEILSDEFKEIVGFEEQADKTFAAAVANNNIRNGMKKVDPTTVPVVTVQGGKGKHIKTEPV